ncbi:MAG TPA: thiaminase II [Candidatus Binatia bacterium]|nr:thiaminase II [Candidatus Binatia bacterium]
MAERFSARLRQKAAAIWEAQHQHPFVRGIGDGSLNTDRFRFWLRQDYVFLIEYARLLAMAAARSPDLQTMSRFATLLKETLETEMDLHRGYAAEFGISREELAAEPAAPTTRGYADFLLRVAATGDFAELAAALLPCMWAFSELGQRLAAHAGPENLRYARWIAVYSSAEFAQLADWCRDLLDRLAAGLPECELQKLESAFLTSSRYEWQFWEMAWQMQSWPI